MLAVTLDPSLTIYLSTLMTKRFGMLTEAGMRMLKKALARRTQTRTGTTKTPTRKKPL